jgi:hypothetical protein
MPLAYSFPYVYATCVLSDQATTLAWLVGVLKRTGATVVETYSDGVLLDMMASPQTALHWRLAVRTGSLPYLWGCPVISLQPMSADMERVGPQVPFRCSGLLQEIFAWPANFWTAIHGTSSRRTDLECSGNEIQCGIPYVLSSQTGCPPPGIINECWWLVATHFFIEATGQYSNFEPADTFRTNWKIPQTGCYVYSLNGTMSWHASGWAGFEGYGTIGNPECTRLTPRIGIPCATNAYQYAGARGPVWFNNSGDGYWYPVWWEPMILFDNIGANGVIQGQIQNCVWATIPSDQVKSQIPGITVDPLDRIDPNIFPLGLPEGTPNGVPGQVYMDPTSMGTVYLMRPGPGWVQCYVH